jgi:hypothetical protein
MADLVLMVPRGLHRDVFPWGVEVLCEYLKHHKPEIDVHLWDLTKEEEFQVLFKEHRACIKETTNLLKKTSHYLTYQEIAGEGSYYSNVMLKFGSELFSILQSEKIAFDMNAMKRHEEQLNELKHNFESILQSKARKLLGSDNRAVFGISVYNGTLFESLYLASVLHKIQDGISIMVGGDNIDVPTARNIIERNKCIDGAVVGFGEGILLDLMQLFSNGTEIQDMQLDGLVNAKTIPRYLSNPDVEEIAAQQASIISHDMPSYVRFDAKKRKISILTRRGCGWGRCTFCKNNVKKTFIDADLAATKRDVKKILDELSVLENADELVFIEFSAENNQIEFMVQLLNWLSNQAQIDKMKFEVWFYMTVQQFSQDVAYELIPLKTTGNINLVVSLAIESLNPVSLKNMRKGVAPLQCLKALKTLHDLNGKNQCFYFTFFPLDNLDGVAQEYYFMKNSLHLISAPKTSLRFLYYLANNRDVISRSPEKYGIELNSYNDIWLNKAFNLDTPSSSQAVDYSLVPVNTAEGKVVNSYFRLMKKNRNMPTPMKGNKIVKRFPILRKALKAFHLLPEISRFVIAQTVLSDFSYLKRNWIIFNLGRWVPKFHSGSMAINALPNDRGDNRRPQFYLKDSRLIKKYPFPFREDWSIELNPLELEVLRYLYGPRKSDDVIARFKAKYSDNAVNAILDKHLHLGSIVRDKNRLMSIFHDPGYLETIKDEFADIDRAEG